MDGGNIFEARQKYRKYPTHDFTPRQQLLEDLPVFLYFRLISRVFW